jgi:hypothetical protein
LLSPTPPPFFRKHSEAFLARGGFRLEARYENNDGLAVLERVGSEAGVA